MSESASTALGSMRRAESGTESRVRVRRLRRSRTRDAAPAVTAGAVRWRVAAQLSLASAKAAGRPAPPHDGTSNRCRRDPGSASPRTANPNPDLCSDFLRRPRGTRNRSALGLLPPSRLRDPVLPEVVAEVPRVDAEQDRRLLLLPVRVRDRAEEDLLLRGVEVLPQVELAR